MAEISNREKLAPMVAIKNMLDVALRQRLVEKYMGMIANDIDQLIIDVKQEIREKLEDDVKHITIEGLRKDCDFYNFADKVMIAIKINGNDGDIVDTTAVIDRRGDD